MASAIVHPFGHPNSPLRIHIHVSWIEKEGRLRPESYFEIWIMQHEILYGLLSMGTREQTKTKTK
jgi:hypothetical protein